jgi:hypothetical protein
MAEYETLLTYLWQSENFFTHLIEVQVHRNFTVMPAIAAAIARIS